MLMLLYIIVILFFFFFSSRRRHTRLQGDWSSDVCSSDLVELLLGQLNARRRHQLEICAIPHEFDADTLQVLEPDRSEERRVGKECRCRRWRKHKKEKKQRREKQ